MKNLKLTAKQVEALLWAIEMTEASYDGWTNADKGKETINDLAVLARVYNKLNA